MTARISPRRICIDTSLRLTTPPNRSVTCSTSTTTSAPGAPTGSFSRDVMSQPSRGRHGGYLGRSGPFEAFEFGPPSLLRQQSGRPEDHHGEDGRADPHLPVVLRHLVLEELREPGEHRGAGHGAGQ